MNRELAKEKAMSRDCSCVKGKDRDNNYNSIIDEIFDWHESEVKKLSIHSVVVPKNEGTLNHKTKVLTKEEVEANRSNAYKYLDL